MIPTEDSLSSGRRWETLDAGVCGGVWGGWRPVPAQQPTASSSSNLLLYMCRLVFEEQSARK